MQAVVFSSFTNNFEKERDMFIWSGNHATHYLRVGGSRSKERDRKSELVLRSTFQIFEWDRNSDRNFYNVVRYVHIPLVPWMQDRRGATCHMAMTQCCYLAKGAKRPSHTTNTIKFDRSIRSLQLDQKVRPLSFRPKKFDLFTATH